MTEHERRGTRLGVGERRGGVVGLAALGWIVGLLWDRFFGDNIPVSATIAGAISAAVCLFAFRRGRLRLAPTQQFAELVREFIPRLIASYVILALVAAAFVWLFAQISGEERPGDALFAATLLGLGLPLWAAPALASVCWWRRLAE